MTKDQLALTLPAVLLDNPPLAGTEAVTSPLPLFSGLPMSSWKNGTALMTPAADGLFEHLPQSQAERVALLQRLLGEPAFRQLGIYPLPKGFKLSVVIPVYNEQ